MAAKRKRVATSGTQQVHSDPVAAAALRAVLQEPVAATQNDSEALQRSAPAKKRKKQRKHIAAGSDSAGLVSSTHISAHVQMSLHFCHAALDSEMLCV